MSNTGEKAYLKKILKALLDNENIPVSKLADLLGVSVKTARTRVEQADQWLRQMELGHIEKRPGLGIRLCTARRTELLAMGYSESKEVAEDIPRNNQVIGMLLKYALDKPVTLQQLAERLYMSAPTVSVLVRSVEGWFHKYNLKIVTVRSKGIMIQGDEKSCRQAMVNYMVYIMPEITDALFETYCAGVNYERVKSIIVDMENAWRIQFAENSFRTAWIMVCLSIKRARHPLSAEDSETEESMREFAEYLFAKSIYDRVKAEFSLQDMEEDTLFLTSMLLSARKIGNDGTGNMRTNPGYFNQLLHQFVREAINIIANVLNEDLSEDQVLYDGLLMHMRSAIFRMKYGEEHTDNISKFVKTEYKQVYLATWSTSSLFESYYGIQITEDEISNIALYIQSALVRKTIPMKALFVSNSGMGSSQLMIDLIKKNIPEIVSVKAISEHDFKPYMCDRYDVVFSNIKLKYNHDRMISIGQAPSDKDIYSIREAVTNIRNIKGNMRFRASSICHQLFRAGYMLVHPPVKDKDELLRLMVNKLLETGDVREDYLQNVMDREKATTTAVGGGIAIPHGNNQAVNESRVVVAVLDQPIAWHEDMVDVVFLLALKMDTSLQKACTQQFYKDFISLTENDEFMKQIRQVKTGLDLYQYFIK
ncbi:BglG family transcription antiterminator [Lacrimispora sp.]|uniref:BglG family transcription antiterminator n=1 Tax=Lacrimispora sp. TaxID=2719234 RepID=UPI0039910BF0